MGNVISSHFDAFVLQQRLLEKIAEGMPRLKVIEGIDGGMREAHLHMGNQIVLISRERFKEVVGKAAMEIAEKIADSAEYSQAIGAIRNLVSHCAAIPINIP